MNWLAILMKAINYALMVLSIVLFRKGYLTKWYRKAVKSRSNLRRFIMSMAIKSLFLVLPFGDILFNSQASLLRLLMSMNNLGRF